MEIEEGSDGSFGAGDGIRTRDINLGKVALYQLSYSREPSLLSRVPRRSVKFSQTNRQRI